MIELSSVWLSGYAVFTACLLPVLFLHRLFLKYGISLRFSIAAQKALSLSMLLVPFLIFLASQQRAPQIGEISQAQPHLPAATNAGKASLPSHPAGAALGRVQESVADVFIPFVELIFLCTMAGLLLFVARIFLQERNLRRWQKGVFERVEPGISLYQSSAITVPFSIGVWNRRVFLPQSLQGQELDVIKSHEINHCRLRHHLWSLLEACQTHVFWFNPLTHALRKTGNTLREMECDEFSVKSIERFTYLTVLLETAESYATRGMLPIRGQGWNHLEEMKMRISHIMDEKKKKWAAAWIASFALATLLAVCGTFYLANRIDSVTEDSILKEIRSQYAEATRAVPAIEFEKLPLHFVKALVLHEDQAFFDHNGISQKGIARATGRNFLSVLSGGTFLREGGSTITQQLAKQFLSERERSIHRKIQEYKVTRVLEAHFSKQEILTMYLNMAYFGNQTVGLAKAAQFYFHTDYDQLSVEQSAMLIPFLDAPSKFNMIANADAAKQRMANLLAKLHSTN